MSRPMIYPAPQFVDETDVLNPKIFMWFWVSKTLKVIQLNLTIREMLRFRCENGEVYKTRPEALKEIERRKEELS